MAFSPPVLGCLIKKGLQKGGHGTPGPPLATPLVVQQTTQKIFPENRTVVDCTGSSAEQCMIEMLQ